MSKTRRVPVSKENLSQRLFSAIGYQTAFGRYSTSLFTRLTAHLLIAALLMPFMLAGPMIEVNAAPRKRPVEPKVKMPEILLEKPLPYSFGETKFSSEPLAASPEFLKNSAAEKGWWESLTSLFGFGETRSAESLTTDSPADSRTVSASLENAQVAPLPPSTADLSRTRLLPKNATGGTGLYSRNFGWGTALAGLSGRSVSAGFGISYNSLVWARVGNEVVFNPDNSNVTPGFQFGYPTIEPSYTDPLTGKNTFLMVTPSGGRVEFRQIDGSSDTFETADSSYIQLKVVNASTLVIAGTDGTHMLYEQKGTFFKCSQIKDANGNFITINHDASGKLQSVTDTLGRVINVAYDGDGQPAAITQAKTTGAFTFATFAYEGVTINTNFAGLTVTGPANGTVVKLLKQITYSDGSHTKFDYNSYGQVWRVSNFAADNSKLNHTAVNFSLDGAPPQADCPRFTDIRSWIQNFNLDGGGQAQETVIPISYQENQSFTIPTGATLTGTLVRVTNPDGTISNTYFGNSGWLEGFPIVSEDWANDNGWNRKRWSWTNYTQDNPNLGYILNPRSLESKVGDAANVRRSTVEYYTHQNNPAAAVFGLVKEVKVYDADQNTVLKRSVTDYNFDGNYISRRIIGLPMETKLFDQANTLMSRVTYNYDEGGFGEAGQSISPIQHDGGNFGAGFVVGRGNMTSTTRWDASDPTNAGKAVTARIKYNTAGNPVASVDPLGREVKTLYNDSFDDNQNRNTFAYPTAIIDPAGNTSTVKYNFDLGANVYATSPAPAGNAAGKTSQRIYDALGRLQRETVLNTGVYTRYEYPTNGVQSLVFSTVTDTNSNGADASDEVLSEVFTDGAGRTLRARTEHPGSTGGWSATLTEYDIMGRVRRSSVPTEINASWQPAGDDASRGWLWMAKEYDWKGRTTREINTDGTDKLFSYEGCGCAGGQVTTIQGEQVAEGRRRQKIYEDILGRTFKTESLNWDGSVYSTVKTSFNGRDQAFLVRQFAGNETSNSFQDTVMTYDGHGRIVTEHRPEQAPNVATVFTYNPDDTLQVKTDGRGATSAFSYDNRKLVTQIAYAMAGTSTPPPPVTNNASPSGSLDGVDSANAKVWGWSMDPDNPAVSNAIHFYIDGAAGTGVFVGSVTANEARSDINQSTGQPGNHGFSFRIPNQYLNGVQHSIYAYGIDNGTNAPSLLGGSPKTFTIGTLPPPSAPTIAQAQAVSQNKIDVYWNQPPAQENVTSYNLRINGSQVITGITYLSYPVTGLAHSTTYTFEVQAVNSSGASAWSLPVSATTSAPPPPPTPSVASVTQNTDNTCLNISLNGVQGAASYDVRVTNTGYTINVTSLNFPWCGLQPGTYYEFQARAVNQYGTSGWSGTTGGATAAPPSNNSSPIGFFDEIYWNGNNHVVRGWSFDPDNPNASNEVHIYVGGPAGSGVGFNTIANVARPDVNSAYGISGNHGFEFALPSHYDGSQQLYVYTYGIDTGSNSPTHLGSSPRDFGTPPPPCQGYEDAILTCQMWGWQWDYNSCQCQSYYMYSYSLSDPKTERLQPDLSLDAKSRNKKLKENFLKNVNKRLADSKNSNKNSTTGAMTMMRAPYPEQPYDYYDPYTPDPPDPGPGPGSSPLGDFNGVDTNDSSLWGWSFDPDNTLASNVIHFYIGGPAGSGTYIGSTTANESRNDVNSAYSIQGQHGFRFPIPIQYQNGQQYTVYAYGLDTGQNGATLLQNSPRTFSFTFQPPPPPSNSVVTFTYDALGNRTSMTDQNGTVAYEYNQLSQMTAETRAFNESVPNAPQGNNSFRLQYAYSMSGQLNALTDPYGQQINYGHDKTGRLQSVTGSSFGGVTNYAQSPKYRAWGALQNLTYGNGVQMNLGFNNRLQVANYALTGAGASAGSNIMQKAYQYYADGALRYAQDQLDGRFDRFNRYDHLGRVVEGRSGAEARGQAVAQNEQATQLPYSQSYAYDAFNNLTQRNNRHWGVDYWYGQSNNLSYSYQNNRVFGATYDADGRMTITAPTDGYTESTYDASGQLIRLFDSANSDIYRSYDGNGREVKRRKLRWDENPYSGTSPYGSWVDEGNTFYIRSSILGNETISEADKDGKKIITYVKANGATLATQSILGTNQKVTFEHYDAAGMSYRTTDGGGVNAFYVGTVFSPGELDPLGNSVGLETPYVEQYQEMEPTPQEFQPYQPFLLDMDAPMYVNGQRQTYYLDGIEVPRSMALSALGNGTAVQCPNNDCGPQTVQQTGADGITRNVLTSPFQAFADGRSGYSVPVWGRVDIYSEDGKTLENRGKSKIIDVVFKEVQSDDDWAYQLMGQRLKILGFDENQFKIIFETWHKMLTDKNCVNAFKQARVNGKPIATPEDVLRKRGYTFMTSKFLETETGKNLAISYGIPEDDVNKLISHFNPLLGKWWASGATTIRPRGSDYEKYPNQRILTVINFSSWFGYSLEETSVHEPAHGSGVPSYYTGPLSGGHDLKNWKDYDNIIKNCSLNGGK